MAVWFGRECDDDVVCIDVVGYSHLAVTGGQSAELPCNTSLTSDMMWTYDIDDGYVDYVFWNGHTAADKPRLSVTATAGGCHSLVISNAQLNDSGLYDCYDGNGTRKAGYRLIIDFAGMMFVCNMFMDARCMQILA